MINLENKGEILFIRQIYWLFLWKKEVSKQFIKDMSSKVISIQWLFKRQIYRVCWLLKAVLVSFLIFNKMFSEAWSFPWCIHTGVNIKLSMRNGVTNTMRQSWFYQHNSFSILFFSAYFKIIVYVSITVDIHNYISFS